MSMNRRARRAAQSSARRSHVPRVDIGETNLRYGGRTIQVIVALNTDEDEMAVLERVRDAARGPKMEMCVSSVGTLEQEDALELWSKAIPAAEKKAEEGSS